MRQPDSRWRVPGKRCPIRRKPRRKAVNHDDLGNYSHSYVNNLKQQNAGMKEQIIRQNREIEALKKQIRTMAGTPKPGDEE
jgi:predicted RNase H-like nuclease (RuvC/YqgF family)